MYTTSKNIKLFLFLLSFGLMQHGYATNQPSMESDGVVLAITEATIADGQAITLLAADKKTAVKQVWWKGSTVIGVGSSVTIKNFNKSKSGSYTLVQENRNGITTSTNYQLNHISLGEDIDACQSQVVDFEVPDGPVYDWSTGALSNNFRITFQESAIIKVSATTEFGYVVEDEKIINISQEVIEEETQTSEVIERKDDNNYSFHGRA